MASPRDTQEPDGLIRVEVRTRPMVATAPVLIEDPGDARVLAATMPA